MTSKVNNNYFNFCYSKIAENPKLSITALVVVTVIIIFFATGGVLASRHLLPSALSWMNAGTIGNWSLVGTAAFLFLSTSIACIYKCRCPTKVSSSTEAIQTIKGKIVITDPSQSRALGKDLNAHLQKLKRIDGKNWTQNPYEILVMCTLSDFNENSSSLIKPGETLLLPFCLFIKNDDYKQIKKDGDLVEFDYDNNRYQFVICQLEKANYTFEQCVPMIEFAYKEKEGVRGISSYDSGSVDVANTKPFDCPLNTNQLSNEQKDILECQKFRRSCTTKPQLNELLYTQSTDAIAFDVPGCDQMNVFCVDSRAAFYAKRKTGEEYFISIELENARQLIGNNQPVFNNGVATLKFNTLPN